MLYWYIYILIPFPPSRVFWLLLGWLITVLSCCYLLRKNLDSPGLETVWHAKVLYRKRGMGHFNCDPKKYQKIWESRAWQCLAEDMRERAAWSVRAHKGPEQCSYQSMCCKGTWLYQTLVLWMWTGTDKKSKMCSKRVSYSGGSVRLSRSFFTCVIRCKSATCEEFDDHLHLLSLVKEVSLVVHFFS